MGFLAGTAGAKLINVNYYVSTSSFTEVTAGGNGVTANADGNIIQVSVTGYTHSWIDPINWFYGGQSFSVTRVRFRSSRSRDRLETLPVGTTRPSP